MKTVHVVAYHKTQPHASLLHNDKIKIHNIPQFDLPDQLKSIIPKPLVLVLKAIYQVLILLQILVFLPRTKFILLQTPPSIPTFVVCKLVSLLKRSKLVIDWHNFGYTILALSVGGGSVGNLMVRAAEWYERMFGKFGDEHLCVTKAMKRELESNWGVKRAHVLYDRAPQFFQPHLSPEELHSLFVKLQDDFCAPMHLGDCCLLPRECDDTTGGGGGTRNAKTLFTESVRQGGKTTIAHLASRPALVVSSTSWTPDEDFGILLRAAKLYDDMTHDLDTYPRLLFVITGKGPMKEEYREKMSRMKFRKVAFRLLWLTAEDYPRLVSAADLGVSLHVSSSGFDLPMKVVDMFGCGVPACSAKYSCVGELVQNNKNGMLFKDAEELAEQLKLLFHNFPEANSRLKKLKAGASASSKLRWTDEWANVGLQIFTEKGKEA